MEKFNANPSGWYSTIQAENPYWSKVYPVWIISEITHWIFWQNIDYDPDNVGDLPKNYKKLTYQIDAVNQGFQDAAEHNGFFLADVVGLGKQLWLPW